MEIRREFLDVLTLTEFADKYDLVLTVREREPRLMDLPHVGPNGRYYASFRRVEVKVGERGLSGAFGNGATEEEAIDNYIKEITGKRLVKDALRDTRVDIPATHICGVE